MLAQLLRKWPAISKGPWGSKLCITNWPVRSEIGYELNGDPGQCGSVIEKMINYPSARVEGRVLGN